MHLLNAKKWSDDNLSIQLQKKRKEKVTCISGSATTYGLSSLSPNARETARTPPTLHVPVKAWQQIRSLQELLLKH